MSFGGGIFNEGGELQLSQAVFDSNESEWGGGLYSEGGDHQINDAVFYRNGIESPDGVGGGICNERGSLTVQNVHFIENLSGYGAGMYLSGLPSDDIRLFGVRFIGNTAVSMDSWRGIGGGLEINTNAQIVNGLFIANKARIGRGVFFDSFDVLSDPPR